jgi:hypothetical protein
MRRRILGCAVALMAVWAMGSVLRAAEPAGPGAAGAAAEPQDQQYLTLAQARAAADLGLRRAHDFEADRGKAWHALIDAGQAAHEQAMADLQRQINEEDHKDDAVKIVAKLEALHAQHDQLDAQWRRYNDVDRPAFEQRWQTAFNRLHAAQEAFDALAGSEHNWKDAGLPLAPLAQGFDAIAKLISDLRPEIEKILTEVEEQQKAWEKRAATPVQPPAAQ